MRNDVNIRILKKVAKLKAYLGIFRMILLNRNNLSPNLLRYTVCRQLAMEKADVRGQQKARDFIFELAKSLTVAHDIKLKRIGSNNDGGYFLSDLDFAPVIISGGIANDVTFENEFASRGSLVLAFDPTIRDLPRDADASIKHFQVGLENTPNIFKKSINLEKAIEIASEYESYKKSSFKYLKLDIEGSEWELLSAKNVERQIKSFDQLIIEFHDFYRLAETKFLENAERVFQMLLSEFHVVAVHSNNYGLMSNFGEAFIPDYMELTFLRNDRYEEVSSVLQKPSFAIEMAPNNANRLGIPSAPFVVKI
jgi:hypothetical protein